MQELLEAPSASNEPVDRDARRLERQLRRQANAAGRMEPELRFRVLLSTLKMETDFLDLADKKARFAMVIMSVLNAVALVLVARGGSGFTERSAWGTALRIEAMLYAAATIHYIWQAIEALRPRGQRGRLTTALPTEVVPGETMRVLFHVDIAKREREEFRALWSDLRLDNVTTELADQLHMVSRINVLKYRALEKLYRGVGVMTVLLTIVLLTDGARRILG